MNNTIHTDIKAPLEIGKNGNARGDYHKSTSLRLIQEHDVQYSHAMQTDIPSEKYLLDIKNGLDIAIAALNLRIDVLISTVQSDWYETNSSKLSYIKNKPEVQTLNGTSVYVDANIIEIGHPRERYRESIQIGSAVMCGDLSVCIGNSSNASDQSTTIGNDTISDGVNNTVVGYKAKSNSGHSVCIGANAKSNSDAGYSVTIGQQAETSGPRQIAIGWDSVIQSVYQGEDSIQLGTGLIEEGEESKFQVWNWPLLIKDTGRIPTERLPENILLPIFSSIRTNYDDNVGFHLYSSYDTSSLTLRGNNGTIIEGNALNIRSVVKPLTLDCLRPREDLVAGNIFNEPTGIPKLDENGKIGLAQMPISQSDWNAPDGSNSYIKNKPVLNTTNYSVELGENALTAAREYQIAIGSNAFINGTAEHNIQLGTGNHDQNTNPTFQVWDHALLDKNTGKIPAERLPVVTEIRTFDSCFTKPQEIIEEGKVIFIKRGSNKKNLFVIGDGVSTITKLINNHMVLARDMDNDGRYIRYIRRDVNTIIYSYFDNSTSRIITLHGNETVSANIQYFEEFENCIFNWNIANKGVGTNKTYHVTGSFEFVPIWTENGLTYSSSEITVGNVDKITFSRNEMTIAIGSVPDPNIHWVCDFYN